MSATRCFVGLELPAGWREVLRAAGETVRSADPGWARAKWVAAENLHITLKFLGNVPDDDLDALSALIGAVVERHASPTLTLGRLEAVPGPRRASMIWATFAEPVQSLAVVAADVDMAAQGFGVAPETRRFAAHATLARARRPHAIAPVALESGNDLLRAVTGTMSVPHVTLFASTLTPTGPVYRTLSEHPFRG